MGIRGAVGPFLLLEFFFVFLGGQWSARIHDGQTFSRVQFFHLFLHATARHLQRRQWEPSVTGTPDQYFSSFLWSRPANFLTTPQVEHPPEKFLTREFEISGRQTLNFRVRD